MNKITITYLFIIALLTTHHTPVNAVFGKVAVAVGIAGITCAAIALHKKYKDDHKYDWTNSNDPKVVADGLADLAKEGLDKAHQTSKEGIDELKKIIKS